MRAPLECAASAASSSTRVDLLGRELERVAVDAGRVGQRVRALCEPLVHATEASRSATPSSPSFLKYGDASAQLGVWSLRGGRGAEASIWRYSPEEAQILRLRCEPSGGQDVLERPVLGEDLGRLLRPDAAGARQLVGRVAAQRDQVGHLLGVDAVALAHLVRADARELAHALRRGEHRHAVADELVRVAIGGRDEHRRRATSCAAAARKSSAS